eukprot:8791337-Prorocentrum_lima.AAC.1
MTDSSTASLNTPFDESKVVMIAVPQILSKLGIVKAGTVWKIRRAVYGLNESPRLWREERDRVLEGMT